MSAPQGLLLAVLTPLTAFPASVNLSEVLDEEATTPTTTSAMSEMRRMYSTRLAPRSLAGPG